MFDFPPRNTDASSVTPALSKGFLNRVGVDAGSATVLVIEDDPGVRHLARRTLESVGYQVLEAFCFYLRYQWQPLPNFLLQ